PGLLECAQRGFTQRLLSVDILPEAETMALLRLHGEHDVFKRGELRQYCGNLVRTLQPRKTALIDGQAGDVLSIQGNGASVGGDFPGQLPDKGGFPCSVGANK